MNLLEVLNDEIVSKGSKWSTLEKAQYLYVRTGEIFQYDDRWLFTNKKSLKNKILNRKFDVENIDDKRIVCKPWSILFKKLADEILGDCPDYVGTSVEIGKGGEHYYNVMTIKDKRYKLDMNAKRDFMLIKKGMMPEEFVVIDNVYGNMSYSEEERENAVIESNFENLGFSLDKGYIEYLKLVKEELLREEGIKGNCLQVDKKKFFKICKFFLKTSQFNNMGIGEVEMLIHKCIKELFMFSSHFELSSICAYNPKDDECELIIGVPNETGQFVNYCLKNVDGKIVPKVLNENIKKHIKSLEYDKSDMDAYIKNYGR